LKSARPKQA